MHRKGPITAHLFSTPKGDIAIRTATPLDATSLLAVRLESLLMHPEAYAADIDQTVTDGVDAWVKLIKEMAINQSGTISIAFSGAELIGMAGITRGHWPKTRHFGSLWGVYVKPGWRGYHIAEAMVNKISEWAIVNEMTVIYLGATISEQSALRCYSRCGFKEYGIEPKAIFYNGNYFDQVLMVKLL
jgi:ribosomal protein S18 acetylase RimI-like enzyme